MLRPDETRGCAVALFGLLLFLACTALSVVGVIALAAVRAAQH